MPLYKVSWRFANDTGWNNRRKWSTTAYIQAANPQAATAAGSVGWSQVLRPAMVETNFCYEVYATDTIAGTDSYDVLPIAPGQQRGGLIKPSGEVYLPKACATVTLVVAGSRPSRKFWRVGLYEAWVSNGDAIDPTILGVIRTAFQNFVAEEVWCDPDSQLYTGVGKITLGTREFGRTAGADVPAPPVG